jgi:hypothetical protein
MFFCLAACRSPRGTRDTTPVRPLESGQFCPTPNCVCARPKPHWRGLCGRRSAQAEARRICVKLCVGVVGTAPPHGGRSHASPATPPLLETLSNCCQNPDLGLRAASTRTTPLENFAMKPAPRHPPAYGLHPEVLETGRTRGSRQSVTHKSSHSAANHEACLARELRDEARTPASAGVRASSRSSRAG